MHSSKSGGLGECLCPPAKGHTEAVNPGRPPQAPTPQVVGGSTSLAVCTWNLRLKLPCRKLSLRFIGPFPIICQVNPVTYHLQLPPSYSISPTFHVSLLKPVHPRQDNATPSDEPRPLDIDGTPAYRVNTILNSRHRWNRLHYLVDWEGNGPEEHSWVNNNILDRSLVEEFHRLHPNRPAPRPRGRPCHRTPG
ncbi:hypothetical protein QTP86_014533, partial [Hemibagrus guttatus]